MSEQELLNQIITLLWRRDWRTEANRSEIDGLLMRMESRIKARAEPEKVEPVAWTEEMADAGFDALEARGFRVTASDIGKDDLRAVFEAMHAAAPQQEQK